MFRATPVNLAKLKKLARKLDAMVLWPYHPVSALYRVMNDDRGLQADFMPVIHRVMSFNRLRSRAERMAIGRHDLWVAHLADIIASKRAAGRDPVQNGDAARFPGSARNHAATRR
jgi:hypothetical protein